MKKFLSLAVAALLGMVSVVPPDVDAVKVHEQMYMNKVHKNKKGRAMISIGLS